MIISKQTKNHKAMFQFMDSVRIKDKSFLNQIADEILINQIKINTESKKQFANVFFSVVKVDNQFFVYSSSLNKENKVFFKIDSSHPMTERYLLEKSKPKFNQKLEVPNASYSF